MAIVRTLLLWAFGVVVGVGLALWWRGSQLVDIPRTAPARPANVTEPQAAPALQSAVVSLRLDTRSGVPESVPGVVVARPDIVVAAADSVARAARIVLETATGSRRELASVWASDDVYGLVALRVEPPLDDVAVLDASAGARGLQRGASYTLLTAGGPGSVDILSNAHRDEFGAYYYEVATSTDDATAAIVGKNAELLGLTLQRRTDSGDAEPQAVDTDPVIRLLAARDRQGPLTLAQFSQHFFQTTPRGRLAMLRLLVSGGRYEEALAHAREIVNLDEYSQAQVPPLANQALAARTNELMTAGRYDTALELLGASAEWLAPQEALWLLRAESHQALGQHGAAIEALLSAGPIGVERARMLILEHALVGGQNDANVALIERALTADADFAPYHRLLGEHYARGGNMPAAIASLERASRLDASLGRELEPLLERLRARRDLPAMTEIPMVKVGGTFLVQTRINGSEQRFRFLLDTGASYTAISTRTALRLGLRNVFLGAPVVELETANGPVFTTTARLDSVEIGGARVNDVQAVILETTGQFDGLLGQSFLRHFDIEIDRTRGVIALRRRLGE